MDPQPGERDSGAVAGYRRAFTAPVGSVSEDELKTWVEVGQPEGGLEADERRMIYSIFQFGDTLCREIMVPRIDVLALEVKTPLYSGDQFTGGIGSFPCAGL